MRKLAPKQQRFAEEYLVDLNATQAAIRAGYSPRTAADTGYDLLRSPRVAELIAELKAARSARVEIQQDDVLRLWIDVATADPNGLVQYRRGCCRYCHGRDHRYQRTRGERDRDLAAWALADEERLQRGKPRPPFDEQGGTGWNPNRQPVADCPECFGDGIGRVFVKDTRSLPAAVRSLYAGVKETKDGLQILMASQEKARELLGQHLGLIKHRHEHSGPDGAPISHRHELSDADLERIAAGGSP